MRKLFVSVFALTSINPVLSGTASESPTPKNAVLEHSVSENPVTEKPIPTESKNADAKSSAPEHLDFEKPKSEGMATEIKTSSETTSVAPTQSQNTPSAKADATENNIGKSKENSSEKQKVTTTPGILKLNEVKSADFFKNPNAFVSCLEPGYWHEVPHASGDGWSGSILVTKDTMEQILGGRSTELSQKLVNKELLNSKASDDKAFKATVIEVLGNLTQFDESTKKDLEKIKLCELTTFSEFLKMRGLERFDKGDEIFERPRVGIPVKYAKGKVVIDSDTLKKVFEKRFEIAQQIEALEKEIKPISDDREEMILPENKIKLLEIKKLTNENNELKKKIDAEKSKNIDEITKIENELKTTLSDEIKKAEAMPQTITTGSGRRAQTITNTARQPAIDKAKKAYDEAEAKLKELTAGYADFEQKLKDNEQKLKEFEEDEDVRSAIAIDKGYDRRIITKLNKIKDNFDRLSVIDPSKITATELKAMKISKETRAQVEELEKLKQINKELNKKIKIEKSKNIDEVTKIENELKTTLSDEIKKAEAMPQTITTGSGRRAQTITNTARQPAIDKAKKAYDEAEAKLKELTAGYADFEKQAKENDERIKKLEADESVMSAKEVLDDLKVEKRAKEKAKK